MTEEEKPCDPWHFAVIEAWQAYWLEGGSGLPESPVLSREKIDGDEGPWLELSGRHTYLTFYVSERSMYLEGEIFPANDAFAIVDQARRFAEVRDNALRETT